MRYKKFTALTEMMDEVNQLMDAKRLLDDLLMHWDPYKDDIEVPLELWKRLRSYTEFDDSE